ncbi:hemolysin III family protein [Candidatus Woesearchaeota archaeon]|nr:hemolysin III family protein [Candidatus Woesearchaeota archaeon]
MRKNNEPGSSLTHLIAASAAIGGLVVLITFSALFGTVWHIVTFSVYTSTMVMAFITSTLYHLIQKETRPKAVFQRLDHCMIYALIAGTYTPVSLIVLRGWVGWTIFGLVWGIAIIGIILKASLPSEYLNHQLFTISYGIMGWLILIALVPLLKVLSINGFLWLLGGGLLYTGGIVFYALDHKVARTRWWGMHEIWHLFVVAGAFCHFWLMLKYVLYL